VSTARSGGEKGETMFTFGLELVEAVDRAGSGLDEGRLFIRKVVDLEDLGRVEARVVGEAAVDRDTVCLKLLAEERDAALAMEAPWPQNVSRVEGGPIGRERGRDGAPAARLADIGDDAVADLDVVDVLTDCGDGTDALKPKRQQKAEKRV
jgi:hypothetical protein